MKKPAVMTPQVNRLKKSFNAAAYAAKSYWEIEDQDENPTVNILL